MSGIPFDACFPSRTRTVQAARRESVGTAGAADQMAVGYFLSSVPEDRDRGFRFLQARRDQCIQCEAA